MFNFVEKHKRLLQVFLGLIALTFATWGIESYTRVSGSTDQVASVNGLKISQREFENERRQQEERMRQLFGGRVDPATLDTPESRRVLLDQMISQRLVAPAGPQAKPPGGGHTPAPTIQSLPPVPEEGRGSQKPD